VRLVLATVLVLAIATLVSPAGAAGAGAGGRISGAEFAKRALSGELSLNGATIDSDVDLSGKTVKEPLTCRNCHFDGKFIASATTFKGVVDLRGSMLQRNANFSESTFKAPALFGSPARTQDVRFNGHADFSVATFSDLVTFEYSVFQGVNFRLARFDAGATFTHSAIDSDADFTRATFQSRVDFSDTDFCGAAVFGGVEFTGPVDFGGDGFEGPVSFHRARLDRGATFLQAMFAPNSGVSDTFFGAQSGGALDFSFAQLGRPVDFSNMFADGEISFHDANLTTRQGVTFEYVSATSLDLSVGTAVSAIDSSDLPTVLALIESSAKARGDLGVANDAHYERKVLESQKDGWLGHAFDFFFYRTIAGYLVRPLQPLAALLILAGILTLVHAGRKAWPHPATTGRGAWRRVRLQYLRARRILPPLGNAYLQTLALLVPGKGPAAVERPVRWLEAIASRLLFVCVLIGFANSNPTLRQMLDAIR
jgi:uncharacterized protein YjbI with pentapeptide repeats